MPYLYLVSLVIIAQLPNFPSLVRSSSAPLSATLPGVSQSVPASLVCCHVRQRSAAEALSTSEPTCSAGTPSGNPAAPFKAAPAPEQAGGSEPADQRARNVRRQSRPAGNQPAEWTADPWYSRKCLLWCQ